MASKCKCGNDCDSDDRCENCGQNVCFECSEKLFTARNGSNKEHCYAEEYLNDCLEDGYYCNECFIKQVPKCSICGYYNKKYTHDRDLCDETKSSENFVLACSECTKLYCKKCSNFSFKYAHCNLINCKYYKETQLLHTRLTQCVCKVCNDNTKIIKKDNT